MSFYQMRAKSDLGTEIRNHLISTNTGHLVRAEDRLRIIVVDGVAGVGKSYLIERIVRERAQPASYKSGKPLLLHVESRGKVLTSLSDRIAGTLSSLRASFFEEELKPLIRRGVIQWRLMASTSFPTAEAMIELGAH